MQIEARTKGSTRLLPLQVPDNNVNSRMLFVLYRLVTAFRLGPSGLEFGVCEEHRDSTIP